VISLFGLVSIVVLVLSAAALVLHFRVLVLRGQVDDSFAQVEVLVRVRIDLIYDLGTNHDDGSELCLMCEEADASHAKDVFASFPEIEKVLEDLRLEPDSFIPLKENKTEVLSAAGVYNVHLEKYNLFIGKLPGSVMAHVIGLKQEKALRIQLF